MKTELVCLYRCNLCHTRMFERDMRGHLERHSIHANGDARTYFVRGRRDTPDKPGGNWRPMYQSRAMRSS